VYDPVPPTFLAALRFNIAQQYHPSAAHEHMPHQAEVSQFGDVPVEGDADKDRREEGRRLEESVDWRRVGVSPSTASQQD